MLQNTISFLLHLLLPDNEKPRTEGGWTCTRRICVCSGPGSRMVPFVKKKMKFSFHHKIFILFLLFINVPFVLTGYMAKNLTETTILQEKESKLMALAHILDSQLSSGGFNAILEERGATRIPREEKIAILNEVLSGITDKVGSSAPGLGVGYYSRELNAIVTYGPSASFEHVIGRSIPADHPGRTVMETNKPLVLSGSMVRGDILNAMIPINRDGKVIGYIWANELVTDITSQLRTMSFNILLVMGLCFAMTAGLLFLLSRRTLRDVGRIINGVRGMRADLSQRIEEAGGELGEVVASINAMAADISKAYEEKDRAMSVLQNVMSNVEALVYVCDPHTKRLVYTNAACHRFVGTDDTQGRLCYEVIQDSSGPCEFCPQNKLFDSEGNPVFTPVHWEFYNANLKRDFMITDRLITWHDGRLLHMEVATDITERNALAVAEAANLAQRDFLARMSHEIRTPMNGVLGMTRLAMQADPPPAQMAYLKKIQASASLLLGIINDILDFSRIEAGKMSIEKHPFSPRAMVDNIRELVLPRIAENDLELVLSLKDDIPDRLVGDELRLSQVLLNLLGNAAKFTLKGHVTLEMSAVSQPSGLIRLSCVVKDSGIGMTREQLNALFKPFTQADSSTSREFGGTGLGLSISKALVELMGGRISANSVAGMGSTFSFYVDLAPADSCADELEKDAEAWEAAGYDGCRFLLVEDNAINQEIAVAVLTELGATVDVAGNGSEGVEAFLHNDYDLVLMDVRMPVMDGLEATRRIRASDKHDARTVPVIAMTANAMREDREASREAGMDGHIAKPIDIGELKSTLFARLKKGAC